MVLLGEIDRCNDEFARRTNCLSVAIMYDVRSTWRGVKWNRKQYGVESFN